VVEPSWFTRIDDYISAVWTYWQSRVAVALMIERLIERAYPNLWAKYINPWFTPDIRRKTVLVLALLAFAWGNFRAFDFEKRQNVALQAKVENAPILVGVRYTATKIPSIYPNYPYGLQVVIQTDEPIKAEFSIVFDGPIGKADSRFIGVMVTTDIRTGVPADHPNVYYMSYGSPQLLPETPLVAYIYSKTAVRVEKLEGD
jgi:hypothetical protein